MADKTDVITECKSQLYDSKTYIKLSLEEMEMLIAKFNSNLLEVISKNKLNNLCSTKQRDFLLSKINNFTVPYFYII